MFASLDVFSYFLLYDFRKDDIMHVTKMKGTLDFFDDSALKYQFLEDKANMVCHRFGFNKMISRSHCRINKRGSQYTITDLQSANGTYVNKVKLQPNQPHPINNGDVIRLANSDFQVSIG